jgi:hypothetical protein
MSDKTAIFYRSIVVDQKLCVSALAGYPAKSLQPVAETFCVVYMAHLYHYLGFPVVFTHSLLLTFDEVPRPYH